MRLPVAILLLSSTLRPGSAAAQRIANPRALRLQGEQVSRVRLLRGDSPEKHFPAAAKKAALDGVVVDTAKTYEFDNPLRRWVLISLTIEFLP